MSANEIEEILKIYFENVDCELKIILIHCFEVNFKLHFCFHTLTNDQKSIHDTHDCDVVEKRRKKNDLKVMIV